MSDYINWLRSKVGHDPVILVGVGAVIHDKDDKILLHRRGGFEEEIWSCSGGLMEIGESVTDTLLREVKEETGLVVEIEAFLGGYTDRELMKYPNGDRAHVISFMFVCSICGGRMTPDGDEALALQWFDKERLPNLFPLHKQPLDDYFSGIRGVIR